MPVSLHPPQVPMCQCHFFHHKSHCASVASSTTGPTVPVSLNPPQVPLCQCHFFHHKSDCTSITSSTTSPTVPVSLLPPQVPLYQYYVFHHKSHCASVTSSTTSATVPATTSSTSPIRSVLEFSPGSQRWMVEDYRMRYGKPNRVLQKPKSSKTFPKVDLFPPSAERKLQRCLLRLVLYKRLFSITGVPTPATSGKDILPIVNVRLKTVHSFSTFSHFSAFLHF